MLRILRALGLSVLVLAVSLASLEILVRLLNASGTNYDIEMWRYSVELTRHEAANPDVGVEHLPGKSAVLQNTEIKINAMGFRDRDYPVATKPEGVYRILVLGNSITFGWGVPAAEVYTEVVEDTLNAEGRRVEIINAGVANHNVKRQIAHFKAVGASLDPNLVVLSLFVNGPQPSASGGNNPIMRNSQLAVMAWSRLNFLSAKLGLQDSYRVRYERLFADESEPWRQARDEVAWLARECRARGITLVITMTPDLHYLNDYPFQAIHDKVRDLAAEVGAGYLDFLDGLRGIDARTLWNMPGDPHPNAKGHAIMANQLLSYLGAKVLPP
ncbi:GDSL-type esterase/lipase family protein [Magnetospirillum sp. UT-4]|uniref:SGNH/GDSL hydrolase family protein n=1 Tax=Magnetospirillum sp. UT-4 TaxID=2681467 RepID=UPI00137FFDA3|nr:GDSL-type esterase/lipase family protein [Magnetospirillum sp. UT-4]CAA7612116.1 conserved exported hypothetical protein [Magnetospirillum sp. UT-4]